MITLGLSRLSALSHLWQQTSESGRRAVNLRVGADVLAAARKAEINLSALLERAVAEELARLQRLQWRAANAAAISAYNQFLQQHGTCFESRWGD